MKDVLDGFAVVAALIFYVALAMIPFSLVIWILVSIWQGILT